MYHLVEDVFALFVLPYMLPDTRMKPDHEKVVYFSPVSIFENKLLL